MFAGARAAARDAAAGGVATDADCALVPVSFAFDFDLEHATTSRVKHRANARRGTTMRRLKRPPRDMVVPAREAFGEGRTTPYDSGRRAARRRMRASVGARLSSARPHTLNTRLAHMVAVKGS